jgi:hypothetical protein
VRLDANRRRGDIAAVSAGLLRRGIWRQTVGPAIVGALLHDSHQVWRNLIALVVTLVDRRPEEIGSWLECEINGIAQSGCQNLRVAALRRHARDSGPDGILLDTDVA